MPDRLGWRRQPCLCLDGSIVVLLMSERCKTLEYEFLDPPNASVVQQAQCRTGLPLSSIWLLSWFNSLYSSLIHQFESQPYHCSASRLCCCEASSPSKSFPVLRKCLCPFGEDVFLAMSPHTASQKYSFDWRHVSFPASSPSLSPLQGLQPWQFPKKHGQERKSLVDNSTLWRAPLPYFPSYLLTKQRMAQSQSGRRSAPPLSSFERWRERPTHTSGSPRPSFSVLMLRPQERWSLNKPPFTIIVVHATTWKWLSLDSCRLCGFQSSCHATCKQRRVWPGAGGQKLGRFRRKFFFFFVFSEKAKREGDEKQRK